MTTTTEAPTRPFTSQLVDVLAILFGHCTGRVQAEARTLSGLGHEHFEVALPVSFVPPVILEHVVVNDEEIRVRLATTRGEVGAIVALVRFPLDFSAETGWRRVPKDGEQTVAEALTKVTLQPSAIIDALGEVVVIWALSSPISADVADPILSRLAERLGSVPIDVTTMIPLAGAIRNVGQALPALAMSYDVAEPQRRYSLETITRAIEDKE